MVDIEIVELACCYCGGSFSEAKAEGVVKCKYCGKSFSVNVGMDFLSKLRGVFDQRDKEKLIRNLNKLTQEISEDFPDKDLVLIYAKRVIEFAPSHAIAQLCEMLIEGNHKRLASFVQSIDKLNLDNETKLLIAKILIDNCESKFHLSISCFLENQIKPINVDTFKALFTKLEDIIEKEKTETFNPRLKRDVFIAHSSKDIELVSELVNALTKANRTFFLSSVNLRHGFNAKNQYEALLKEAMTASKIFLMINTKNSRSAYCDVYKKEIPFIEAMDKSVLPAEYKHIDYANIPTIYKKPRINYLVDSYNPDLIQDQIVKDFFDGFEYRLSITDVLKSIEHQLTKQIIPPISPATPITPNPIIPQQPYQQPQQPYQPYQPYQQPQQPYQQPQQPQSISNDFRIENGKLKGYRGDSEVVEIPSGVTQIDSGAFSYKKSIITVTIPFGVTQIGEGAFWGCTNLTSITIPNSVTQIGDKIFWDCKNLKSVTIPNSVTQIGDKVFWGCTNLVSVTIGNSIKEIGEWFFRECKSLVSVTIPNGVTRIGDRAFSNCKSLVSVTIPNSVTQIGESAFYECVNLTSVTIPAGVERICDKAFWQCESLTSLTISNGVKRVGDWAFCRCAGLSEVKIPPSVVQVGSWAFSSNNNLTIYVNENQAKGWKKGWDMGFNGKLVYI